MKYSMSAALQEAMIPYPDTLFQYIASCKFMLLLHHFHWCFILKFALIKTNFQNSHIRNEYVKEMKRPAVLKCQTVTCTQSKPWCSSILAELLSNFARPHNWLGYLFDSSIFNHGPKSTFVECLNPHQWEEALSTVINPWLFCIDPRHQNFLAWWKMLNTKSMIIRLCKYLKINNRCGHDILIHR